MTLERVDLPEPFGPMMAWTSPFGMVRVTPLRISVPFSRVAWRSWMCRLMFWKVWLVGGMESGTGDLATQGDLEVVDEGAGREFEEIGQFDARLDADVVDDSRGLVVEVAMLLLVGAVAG